MHQNQIQTMLEHSAQDEIKKEIKEHIQHSVIAHIRSEDQDSVEATGDNFKANDETRRILKLFSNLFKPRDCKQLGLQPIIFKCGKWYLPWDKGSYQVDLEPDVLIGDARITRPDYQDATQQSLSELRAYLTDKQERRHDGSLLARPYKTFLARLIYHCIERIETLKEVSKQHYYYDKLTIFLDSIWSDETLVDHKQRHDTSCIHLEHFIYKQMKLCEQRAQSLITHQPISLVQWIDTLDRELAALHICGARAFHALLQNKKIPAHLDQELHALGNTYHDLVTSTHEYKSQSSNNKHLRFAISPSLKARWQHVSKKAHDKISYQSNIDISLLDQSALMLLVQKKVITLEEALFFNTDEYYSADQCLYCALYAPDALSLSNSDQLDRFGSTDFLDLYRTEEPLVGFQWLKWHIQEASDTLLPTLQTLETIKLEDEATLQYYLHILIKEVEQLRDVRLQCPPLHSIGALPELSVHITYQASIVTQFSDLISQLQKQLHYLVLIRALLKQYRSLLPQTGEVIGGLALQTDLDVIASIVKQIMSKVLEHISSIMPLQSMGYVPTLNEGSDIMVVRQESLLKLVDDLKNPSQSLKVWRAHKRIRKDALESLETRVIIGWKHLAQLNAITAPARTQQLVKRTQKQFSIARLLLTVGLSEHISATQKAGLEAGDRIIEKWAALSEQALVVKSSDLAEAHPTDDGKRCSASPLRFASKIPLSSESKSLPLPAQTIQMPSQKEAKAASATAVAPYAAWMYIPHSMANTMLNVIRGSTQKSPEAVYADWLKQLEQHQEVFYGQWQAIQSTLSAATWTQWIQQKTGMLYGTVPRLDKPAYFQWWYRHTLEDRTLCFRALCLSTLIEHWQAAPHELTPNMHECLSKILEQERAYSQVRRYSLIGWLDSFHCKLKSKWKHWAANLQHQIATTAHWRLAISPAPVAPSSVVAPAQADKKIESAQEVTVNETHDDVSSPETDQQVQAIANELLMRPVAGLEWIDYQSVLMQASPKNKEAFCLAFFSLALTRIQQKILSIQDNPEQDKQCQHAITLLYRAIQSTLLEQAALGKSLRTLQEVFRDERCSPSSRHFMFAQEAETVLEEYAQEYAIARPTIQI